MEHWNSTVEKCNCVVEERRSVEQCGGTLEKYGETEEQCDGTVWSNSVEQYGGIVWNSMLEQWNSLVEQCG